MARFWEWYSLFDMATVRVSGNPFQAIRASDIRHRILPGSQFLHPLRDGYHPTWKRILPSPLCHQHSILTITELQQQEFQLGQKLRSLYLDPSSPNFIPGINTTIVDISQIHVRADAGGESGVILNSAMSLVQGLFPATTASNTSLANGTTIVGPLGGYQVSLGHHWMVG